MPRAMKIMFTSDCVIIVGYVFHLCIERGKRYVSDRGVMHDIYVRSHNYEKRTISFVTPILPSARKTRLALRRFSWNLIFEYLSKIYREISRFFKIRKE